MKAVYIRRFGGNDVLEIGELPDPAPGRGELLVRVRAAAVNPRDWMIRSGTYPFRFTLPRFPVTLGGDFAGEVAEFGKGATGFSPGDRVYGMQRAFGGFGAFAEYIVVRPALLARIPATLDFEHAAAVPLAALTAWHGLHANAGVQPGQTVLVNGAAGGVGSFAVQLAVAAGAKVTGVCSRDNLDFVLGLGAADVIDYRAESFLDSCRRWDVIFDAIGRETWARCRNRLARAGRYLTTVPKRADILAALATSLSGRVFREAPRCALILARSRGDRLEAVSRLIEAGRIRVHVEEVFGLEETAVALARSRTFRTRGKLVLRVP